MCEHMLIRGETFSLKQTNNTVLIVPFSPAVKPEKWQNRSLFDKSMELGRMIQL